MGRGVYPLLFISSSHLFSLKNYTFLDSLVSTKFFASFSFDFRCNLTNKEATEVAYFLSLLEGSNVREGSRWFRLLILVGFHV